MEADGIAKIIQRLEHIATRPGVFCGDTPEAATIFLNGFDAACWGLGYSVPNYLREAATVELGCVWSPMGPVDDMRKRGIDDIAIVHTLIAIEIAAWKRLASEMC